VPLARPGEFSERAFLNGRIDLARRRPSRISSRGKRGIGALGDAHPAGELSRRVAALLDCSCTCGRC